MISVIVFGATGYIGSEFLRQLRTIGGINVVPMSSRMPDGKHYTQSMLKFMIEMNPNVQIIINCAAFIGKNSVVDCEKNKEETILSNVIFPRMLAEICESNNIILGHFSSACVFDGYTEGGYTEDDPIHLSFGTKCSFYTGTKVMAEDILSNLERKYIWRIRLPFDNKDHPRNYLSKMMKFDRLIVAENSLSNRVEAVNACIKCLLQQVPFGTYHVVNSGGIRTDELVVMFRKILGNRKNFQYFSSTEELDKITKIPRSNTVISCKKLSDVGIHISNVHDSVEHCLRNWITE